MQKFMFVCLLITGGCATQSPLEPEPESGPPAALSGTVPDYYSPLTEWRDEGGALTAPIHVSLLPDGNLHFMGLPEFTMPPDPPGGPFPAFVTVATSNAPVEYPFPGTLVDGTNYMDSVICGGHTLTADGTLLVAGGTRFLIPEGVTDWIDGRVEGLEIVRAFDHTTRQWSEKASMKESGAQNIPGARWYPTLTRAANGDIFSTGGYDVVNDAAIPGMSFSPNRSIERYDVAADTWTTVSTHLESPQGIENPDYTHFYALPSPIDGYDFLVIGAWGQPSLFDPDQTPKWRTSPQIRPGVNPLMYPGHGSSSTLLPIRLNDGEWGYANGSIAVVGGGDHGQPQIRNIDIYDPAADAWRAPSIDMSAARHHPSSTLLPDGRMLVLAGHDDDGGPTGHAQYLNLRSGTFSLVPGTWYMDEIRGYHTVTVLLPDGRILIGSGNDDGSGGNEKPTYRYYYPDYMFMPRPAVLGVQPTISIGENFWIATTSDVVVSEIVMMGLGSMTHSYDMSQRYVQVEHAGSMPYADIQAVFGTAPGTASVAPPGYYMVFVIDDAGVPSVGQIVQLVP